MDQPRTPKPRPPKFLTLRKFLIFKRKNQPNFYPTKTFYTLPIKTNPSSLLEKTGYYGHQFFNTVPKN